jgi:hypothetical protein
MIVKQYLRLLRNRFVFGLALLTLANSINLVSITFFNYDLSTNTRIEQVR